MFKIGVGHINIAKHIADLESEDMLKKSLMGETKCVVRLYMVTAYDLASRDNGSFSDPYLIISCGKKVYNERDNYIEDEPNPNFYKSYDFEAVFPGCPPIDIKAMDYDLIFGDDAIGTTQLDLEDRFFMPEWQCLKNKPIEFRQIYHKSSACSQGVIKMWAEIWPTSIPMQDIPLWDITPKAPEIMEVRLVIWDTVDVICMDAEGTSDVYIRAFFDTNEQVRQTDTHFRCQNGKASFNYRLLFDVEYPRKDYTLTI